MRRIRTRLSKRSYLSGKVVWVIRWKDERTGLWKAVKAGETENEALIAEAELRQDILKGLDPIIRPERPQQDKIGELIDLLYLSPRYQTNSPRWQRVVKCQLEGHIRKKLGQQKISDLNRKKIFDFYLGLKKDGLSHHTIRSYHFLLRTLGDLWVGENPSKTNPVRAIQDFRKVFPREAPTRDINFLTLEEVALLLVELAKEQNRLLFPFVALLAFSGLRRSEGLRLKWSDIDEKGGFIHIRNSKSGKPRSIPIESELYWVFKLLSRKTTYLFANESGEPYREGGFLKSFQKAAKRTEINKRVDLHTLRHSWGSNKIRGGWGLKKVSMMLGHSDIGITAKTYTHYLDGDYKVRDEFRVENFSTSENSGESNRIQDRLISESTMGTINTLQTQIKLLQDSSERTLNRQEALSLGYKISLLLETFGKIQNALGITPKIGAPCLANVSQIPETKKDPIVSDASLSKFFSDFNLLNAFSMVHPPRFERGTLSSED